MSHEGASHERLCVILSYDQDGGVGDLPYKMAAFMSLTHKMAA